MCLSVLLYSIFMSIYLSSCLSCFLCVHPSVHPPICPPPCLPCLPVSSSPVCPTSCPSVGRSIDLSHSFSSFFPLLSHCASKHYLCWVVLKLYLYCVVENLHKNLLCTEVWVGTSILPWTHSPRWTFFRLLGLQALHVTRLTYYILLMPKATLNLKEKFIRIFLP